ncbi:hypothetical protein M513_02016 [Trichuris suis]|uniref:Uncharacterized protein n=1 Tax=Trichuris suis TaxID=68888 RepID=A0A085MIT5_9BILA|nr:hypothetical protein M513_02016 [Trichuris suis]
MHTFSSSADDEEYANWTLASTAKLFYNLCLRSGNSGLVFPLIVRGSDKFINPCWKTRKAHDSQHVFPTDRLHVLY